MGPIGVNPSLQGANPSAPMQQCSDGGLNRSNGSQPSNLNRFSHLLSTGEIDLPQSGDAVWLGPSHLMPVTEGTYSRRGANPAKGQGSAHTARPPGLTKSGRG
jgi:hypothetical protein